MMLLKNDGEQNFNETTERKVLNIFSKIKKNKRASYVKDLNWTLVNLEITKQKLS